MSHLQSFGLVYTFVFSLMVCLLGAVVALALVPETKDLTAEEIGEIFGRKPKVELSA